VKSIFRATAILSGSSMVSILCGLLSAKVLALLLQPAGYGYYGLLQSFVAVVTIFTGFGMASGLVRLGAQAAAQNDEGAIAALRSGAWFLFGVCASATLAILILFRTTLSRWALGNSDHGWTIILMGVAVLFTVAGNIQMGTLNTYHRVSALAKYSIANTLGGVLITIPAVAIWRSEGVLPAVIANGVLAWGASRYFLYREIGPGRAHPNRTEVLKSALALFRFGGPFMAGGVVGTGVQLALPMMVVHLLNADSVGYYKAAAAISVGYLGFLVSAMGLDYYPRASAVANQPQALVKLINEQHRLVMLVAIPVILGMLALVPILVPLIYSRMFTPAVDILEWQLIGDIFKFSSWTMSYVVLARYSSSIFLLNESIAGGATLLMTWVGVKWFGLAGLGISFLATYIIYYFSSWLLVRREVPLVWTTSNKIMIVVSLVAALVIRFLPSTRFAAYRTPVGLTFALIVGIPSLYIIWREFRAGGLRLGGELNQKISQKAV
jgi:PST family polysaccharide transporter